MPQTVEYDVQLNAKFHVTLSANRFMGKITNLQCQDWLLAVSSPHRYTSVVDSWLEDEVGQIQTAR